MVYQVKNSIQLASNTKSVYVTKLSKAKQGSTKALVKASKVDSLPLKNIDGISKSLIPEQWRVICKKLRPAQLNFVMKAKGIMITGFLSDALKDVSDWSGYPVINRAIIVAYLAYTDNFNQAITERDKVLMNKIVASIQPKQKSAFVQTLLRISQDSKSHLSNIGLSISNDYLADLIRYAPTSKLVRQFLDAGTNTRIVQDLIHERNLDNVSVEVRGVIAAYLLFIGGLAFEKMNEQEVDFFNRLMDSVSEDQMGLFVKEVFRSIGGDYLHISSLSKVISNKQMLIFFRHVKDKSLLSLLLEEH